MSFIGDAEKVLKVAQEIVEVMKKADLTEEEAMDVMNVLDMTLFPDEYEDGYDEEEFDWEDSCLCPIFEIFGNMPDCENCDGCENCEDSDECDGCEFRKECPDRQ